MIRGLRKLILSTVICGVGAITAAIWADELKADAAGMAAGVGAWILLYTIVSCTAGFADWAKQPVVRRALWITYGTRLGCSIIVPAGMAIDLPAGMLASSVIPAGHNPPFAPTMALTILVGVFIHIFMAVYFGIVYAIAGAAMAPRRRERQRGFEVLPAAERSSAE